MSAYYENPDSYGLSFAKECPSPDPVYSAVGMTVLSFNTLRHAIREAISWLSQFPEAAIDGCVFELDFMEQVRVVSAAVWLLEPSKLFNTDGLSAPGCWHELAAQCEKAYRRFEEVTSLDSPTLRDMAASLLAASQEADRSEVVASRLLESFFDNLSLAGHVEKFFEAR